MAVADINSLTRPLQSDLVGERGERDYEKPEEKDHFFKWLGTTNLGQGTKEGIKNFFSQTGQLESDTGKKIAGSWANIMKGLRIDQEDSSGKLLKELQEMEDRGEQSWKALLAYPALGEKLLQKITEFIVPDTSIDAAEKMAKGEEFTYGEAAMAGLPAADLVIPFPIAGYKMFGKPFRTSAGGTTKWQQSGEALKSTKKYQTTLKVEDALLNKIGKENLENMTQKEIREVLESKYGIKDYDQSSLRVKLKKLNITPAGGRPNVNKMMTETVGEADLKKITKYIKDNKPYTTELIEKFPILKNLKYKTVSDWRAKNKLNIFKESDQTPKNFVQAYNALDDVNKTTINNFIDKTKDVIGYGTKKRLFEIKRSSVKRKIESMIGRLIHRAEKDGVDINTALKSLDDVNIKELVDVIKQNSILRNRIDQAKKELGITLKDFNLSHIEDVARNYKNTLKADNLFFLETKKNLSLQPKLEKKIDKILENLSNAKTKKDKTSLLNDLANVEKEMIDNNIISNIDGIIYGDKSITAKSSFDRFSKEFADQAYEGDPLMARFKNGGIVGISHLTRPL